MSIIRRINNTRESRLAFSILTPPLIGSTVVAIFFVASLIKHDPSYNGIADAIVKFFSTWFMITILAYLLMGLQSIAAALTMELVIRHRTPNKRWFVIAWVVLGGLSGATLQSIFTICLGFATGLIIGLCMTNGFQPKQDTS